MKIILILMSFIIMTPTVHAADPLCPDSEIFGTGLVTKICWSCLFPIKIFGSAVGGDIPQNSKTEPFCFCDDLFGVPEFGITMGAWFPARVIELTRAPYCSPLMGGVRLGEGHRLHGGARTTNHDNSDKTYYNYHYYAFPLYLILELFTADSCNKDGYYDLDLMYLSEFDPSWNHDEIAFLLNPEAAVFANPAAMAACSADCGLATADIQKDEIFWCAGCWGNLYPFSGHVASANSPVGTTSLLATRSIAALHRRGLARRTMGDDALCSGQIYPMVPRTQYKMSMLFPVPEASGDCCHGIGESTFTWGEHRNIPGAGEDYVYLLWRFQDCCLR